MDTLLTHDRKIFLWKSEARVWLARMDKAALLLRNTLSTCCIPTARWKITES